MTNNINEITNTIKGYTDGVPATIMRGGSSKGVFFKESDINNYFTNINEFKGFLASAFGVDKYGKQIDGIGGGTTVSSKAAIIGINSSNEITYKFFQLALKNKHQVSDNLTCGNILSAVLPYAIYKNIVNPPLDATLYKHTIRDVNTKQLIESNLPLNNGKFLNLGSCYNVGVENDQYAPIELKFMNPDNACLKGPEPLLFNDEYNSGNERFQYSVIDSATLLIVIKVNDLTKYNNDIVIRIGDLIRQTVIEKLNLQYKFDSAVLPKILFFESNNTKTNVVYLTPHTIHNSLAISGGVAFCRAHYIQESICYSKQISDKNEHEFVFYTQHGEVHFLAQQTNKKVYISVIRSSKRIFDGLLFN